MTTDNTCWQETRCWNWSTHPQTVTNHFPANPLSIVLQFPFNKAACIYLGAGPQTGLWVWPEFTLRQGLRQWAWPLFTLRRGLRQWVWCPRSQPSHSSMLSASPLRLQMRQRALRTERDQRMLRSRLDRCTNTWIHTHRGCYFNNQITGLSPDEVCPKGLTVSHTGDNHMDIQVRTHTHTHRCVYVCMCVYILVLSID